MSNALRLEGVDAYYGQSRILRDISLTVKPSSITAIMGRNGVGKTTLLKTIMGILPAAKGKIYMEDTEVTQWPTEKRVHRGLGYVPQGREIFPRLRVDENLKIGLQARNDGLKKVPKDEIYDLFPFIQDMESRQGGNLSGGQQQQLAIARALVGDPNILILDEPTEGIQPSIIQDIQNVLQQLRKRGNISIILVEQYFEFAREIADHFYLMDRGSIILQGSAGELSDVEIKKHLTF